MKKKILLSIFIASIFAGCGGSSGSGSSTNGAVVEESNDFSKQSKEIVIDNSNHIYRIKNAQSSNIELNIKENKDIFVVVTSRFDNQPISIVNGEVRAYRVLENNSTSSSSSKESKKEIKNKKRDLISMRKEINNILFSTPSTHKRGRYIAPQPRLIDDVHINDTTNFCIDMDKSYNCTHYISASAKKIVKRVPTEYGEKSLVIWLESGNNLSQERIDELSNTFLKRGGSNDIYDWVGNVLGEEWGDDAIEIDNKLIAHNDIIDILVYDMKNSSLAGYYWGKDNFRKSLVSASNEKIMFYLNSELLKRAPKETYTTLSHEFQHMIHFYQRSVVKGIEDSPWYDELMSEAIEDLVSTKIGYMGPRHVDPNDGTAGSPGNRGGRYPTFNRYNTASLTKWYNTTKDYSIVSSFGAYLLRNYGGASVLNRMMYSQNQDEYAILDATGERSFSNVIANWGSAVVLSDKIGVDKKYQYNFGDFKYSTFKSTVYELGSINFFNYIPQPQFRSSATLNENANLYYKIGDNLSGTIRLNINIPKGADITIIAK